ncbi:hypothetical protein CC86DRAFT_403792 [Ophiobolus disseminans]|uniref:Uncharacterized protein n=1 Tax=Ophiobolus disseminans TaxID=1469910 RepID=A0A6A7A8U1_9PLEO|nr:hypothetical protein CC86DRAFT_403792 [Ophiobolus disseminans]
MARDLNTNNDATLELAERFATELMQWSWGLSTVWRNNRDRVLGVRRLLEAGADPNIFLCGYQLASWDIVHQMMPADPTTRFLEEPFIQQSVHDRTVKTSLKKDVRNLRLILEASKLDLYFVQIKNPVIDAISRTDHEMIAMFTEFGAELSASTNQIPMKDWAKVANPFQSAMTGSDEPL